MGFRSNSYAKVWSVEPISDVNTKLRISISRKNRQTNEYEQDFSGFVSCIGTATAKRAASLKEGDKIKLGDVDVSTRYDKDKGVQYTNFKVFSFEIDNGTPTAKTDRTDPQPDVDGGEVDDSNLPF